MNKPWEEEARALPINMEAGEAGRRQVLYYGRREAGRAGQGRPAGEGRGRWWGTPGHGLLPRRAWRSCYVSVVVSGSAPTRQTGWDKSSCRPTRSHSNPLQSTPVTPGHPWPCCVLWFPSATSSSPLDPTSAPAQPVCLLLCSALFQPPSSTSISPCTRFPRYPS